MTIFHHRRNGWNQIIISGEPGNWRVFQINNELTGGLNLPSANTARAAIKAAADHLRASIERNEHVERLADIVAAERRALDALS